MNFFLVLLLSGMIVSSYGDDPEHPLLPVDTSSPRATLNSFVDSCSAAYALLNKAGRDSDDEEERANARDLVERIMRCMDLSEIPEFRRDNAAKEAAVSLKEVLDRIELPKENAIPDLKGVSNEDGSFVERWTIPNTEITLIRIPDGRLGGSYQFSSYTVTHASDFYRRVKHLPYKKNATENFANTYLSLPGNERLARIVNNLPKAMHERKSGQAVWQWAGLGIVLLLTVLVMILIYFLGRRLSRKGIEGNMWIYVLALVFPIIATIIPFHAQRIITNELVISGKTLYLLKFNLGLVTLFAGMVVVLGIGRRVGEVVASAAHLRSHSIDAQLIRIVCRMFGFISAMVLLLQGGQHLGIPLSSLLAGAGVMGMALALSAQDVLKNVFGSIMLILDKPFIVGERIKVGCYDGVVEEIGLRSTKLRLLNGHQASIPNEAMARNDIENIGRRPFIRRVSNIRLPFDIGSDRAEEAVKIIEDLLEDHEGMSIGFPPRVWLNDFEDDHLELKMIYWYHPAEYWKYTKHADKVNRTILQTFTKAGIGIALPAFRTKVDDQSGWVPLSDGKGKFSNED